MLAGTIILLILSTTCNCELGKSTVSNKTSTRNTTISEQNDDNPLDLAKNPGLVFVLFASLCASLWLLYITFFNSRLIGFILTKVVNRFLIKDDAYFKIGSFSLSLLNGKFMFRDVKYITKDFSVRVVDGYAIFAWWLRYTPNESNDYHGIERHPGDYNSYLSRLTIHLNGFEAHLYNRSSVYDRLNEIFKNERYGDARRSTVALDAEIPDVNDSDESSKDASGYQWMDLIPTIRFNINSGKVALGNKLVETTFWIHTNNAVVIYSTSTAASSVDEFTHVIKGKCEDVRVMLSPSPGFTGQKSQPPRFMGEGFVILQSGELSFDYRQDVPGIIPENFQSAPEADPDWSLNLTFTKATTITYGPWADKQREKLQRLFLPQDYQEMHAARPIQPGERRVHTGFDLKTRFQAPVAMDILFSKNDELSALHVCAEQGSYIHFFMPWAINEFGYTSTLLMHLQKLDLTTSLDFRKFLECEVMEAEFIMTVPRIWNQFQHWSCEFIFSETTMYFIYQHTNFIQDLLNDWACTAPADIAYFVPYEWEFKFHFRNYELICLVNEHNWIDSNNDNENSQMAFCGEALEISFVLPFTKFLPEVEEIRFFCRAESLVLRLFMTDSNTLRRSVLSLVRNCDNRKNPDLSRINSFISDADDQPERLPGKDNKMRSNLDDLLSKGWRRKTGADIGWFDVCSSPVLVLNIFYKFHPVHASNDHIEEINKCLGIDFSDKDPASLSPDLMTVELEVGPLSIKLLGSLFRQFIIGFKENYFGISQKPTEFDAVRDARSPSKNPPPERETGGDQDSRHFRPMHANVTIVLLDIKAELTKHCSPGQAPSPILNMERLTFEMNKTYKETMLQLITSSTTIAVRDCVRRSAAHNHLSRGFLSLSGLQFRGDAFFSDRDIPRGSDTIEYAWQMEFQCGEVSGKLTLPQVQSIGIWLEVFMLHFMDEENALSPPIQDVKCQHGTYQRECKQFEVPLSKSKTEDVVKPILCPTEAELKYKMSRFSIESVNLFLVEAECACNIKASPIRISSCTSHTNQLSCGGSIFINDLIVKQFVQDLSAPEEVDRLDGSSRLHSVFPYSNNWLEVAVATFGPITADTVSYTHDVNMFHEQQKFLRKHDKLLKKLWFLWKPEKLKSKIAADRARSVICGCVGGCRFFGNNVNGVRFFTVQVLDAGEMQFSRYGSESIWGGVNERQGIEKRLRYRSGGLSLQSLGESSLRLRKASEITARKPVGRAKSMKDSDSIGLWSSMSGSMRQSEYHRESMASRLPNDRSRSIDIGGSMSMRSRQRTESEGTFYSCESEIASLINGHDVEDLAKKKTSEMGSQTSLNSSGESFISAVSSKEDLVSFDVTDAPLESTKPLMSPALASLYAEHLRKATCTNWKYMTPEELSRRCSLLTNLKAIYLPARTSTSVIVPNFQHDSKGKLPFVIVNKRPVNQQPANLQTDACDGDDSVFHHTSQASVVSSTDANIQRSAVNLKIHKGIDLVITPVLLQSIERYIQSLKNQEKIQHPAYILDSLHLGCIESSKNRHSEIHALKVLRIPNDADVIDSKRSILSNLFPRKCSTMSLDIPRVNFVSLQVSPEPFCVSEQSSLSGQCGSKYSNDFGFPKCTCTVAIAASFSELKLSQAYQGEHEALKDLTVSLLRRRSVFRSNHDYMLLKEIHELTESSNKGVIGTIDRLDIQLQRLDCETFSEDSSFVTAIPNTRTMIPFIVYKGDDVDVDDLSCLEHKLSTPMGKIMLELGVKKVSMNTVLGEGISVLKDTVHPSNQNSPGKDFNRSRSVSKTQKEATETASKTEVAKECRDVTAEVPMNVVPINNENDNSEAKPSILEQGDQATADYLLEEDGSPIQHIVLEIQDSDTEDSKPLMSQVETETSIKMKLTGPKEIHSEKQKEDRKANEPNNNLEMSEYALKKKTQGEVHVKDVWFNLAHPSKLKVLQEGNDHCVNLITSIVPSICCWIPVYVDLIRSTDATVRDFRTHRYSLVAYIMGQALPDKGRLLVKHNINSMGTEQATFLQEDHSSQLVYVLRRHLIGSRLRRVISALEDKKSFPKLDVFEKGIHALARQWNAVIIRPDMTFKTEQRKHVVGRGVLTRKDLAILMRDRSSLIDPSISIKPNLKENRRNEPRPGDLQSSGSVRSKKSESVAVKSHRSPTVAKVEGKTHDVSGQSSPGSARSLLRKSSSDGSTSPGEFTEKKDTKEELNLYDWLSSTNSPRQLPDRGIQQEPSNMDAHEDRVNDGSKNQNQTSPKPPTDPEDAGIFRMKSPMVSLPTSGMQLENATEIFKCLFDAIGLDSLENDSFASEEEYSGSFGLQKLEVNIVSSEETCDDSLDEAQMKSSRYFGKGSTALQLKQFCMVGHGNMRRGLKPAGVLFSVNRGNDPTPKDIKIDVSLGNITQIVNIALIRLIMQISETIDVVKEENRFAQKIKSLELVGSEVLRSGTATTSLMEREEHGDYRGWKTMYNVMQLYTNEQVVIKDQEDVNEQCQENQTKDSHADVCQASLNMEGEDRKKSYATNTWVDLSTFVGTVRLSKVRLIAYIGGMDFETELTNLNGSYYKIIHLLQQKADMTMLRKMVCVKLTETNSTAVHLDGATLVLTESLKASQQSQKSVPRSPRLLNSYTTITTCKINKSHVLVSSKPLSKMKTPNRVHVVIGNVFIDIPQHPGILRTVTTRFTKRLEKHFIEIDHYRKSKKALKLEMVDGVFSDQQSLQDSILSDDVTMSIRIRLQSVSVGAALLPSLTVTYKIGEVTSNGNVGIRTTYNVKMPNHGLHFQTTKRDHEALGILPSTSVDLPPITVKGEYIVNNINRAQTAYTGAGYSDLEPARTSTFLRAIVDIGRLEQSLTTDLLNQLIFLQKGFIKEVNQVISDVDENEPVPLWMSFSKESLTDEEHSVPLLYSIQVNLKGIQITATTPSSTAVRLHTGIVALELSNRSPNKEKKLKIPKRGSYMKLFGRAEVDFMVSLGQYHDVQLVDTDDDFQTFAYFKTRIGLTNTLQDKPIFHHSQDKETVIITINRPHIYLMPMAVDKGLLVYLYYKNAYDYWMDQTVEVQKAAQHIWEKLPQRPQAEKLYGSIFLQLNVEKLGLSIPLNDTVNQTVGNHSILGNTPDPEMNSSALVVTVEETSIMCCSSGSFVSQGLFRDFCLRFANDFDTKAEEWTFSSEDVRNTCSIPEGTYSLCSRTETQMHSETPQSDKWLMSIFWKMCGIDMYFTSNIGKWLSSLSNALTAFAGDVDVADLSSVADAEDESGNAFAAEDDEDTEDFDEVDAPPPRFEPLQDKSSNESQYYSLERQLWRQTKIVSELRHSCAAEDQINREVKFLQDIESAISQEFFKDVRKRLRRHSRKPSGGYMDRLQSPAFLRKPETGSQLNPKRPFHRRHSSVERYFETKELDYIPKRKQQLQDEEGKRLSFDSDSVDGGFLEVADFRSHPDLSDHEMDVRYEPERKTAVKKTAKTERAKTTPKKDKKDLLSPGPAKVTFSDSTFDVRSGSVASQRQNISNMLDFQLDIVVDIDSGKCVLRNENSKDEEEEETHIRENLSRSDLRKSSEPAYSHLGTQFRKERYSVGETGPRSYAKRSRAGIFNQPQNANAVEDTVLLIPGVNVRVHYQSKTTAERFPRTGSFTASENSDIADNVSSSSSSWKSGHKSAGLHAWLNIQQLPREMILLPSLLDFVDNALAPISLHLQNPDDTERNDSDTASLSSENMGNGAESIHSSSTSDHSSFPVDVVVFINVQPSDIRFSCLPVSKVECLLRIPSLDFVISSTSTPLQTKSVQPSTGKKAKPQFGSQKTKTSSTNQEPVEANIGGFCITACLSRFSFCIFHPYGKQYGSTSERSFLESGLFPGRRKKRGPVPQPISGRKDSLSLNVEFIKFSLFRKRIKESQFASAKGRRSSSSDLLESKTEVQVSITCDIGSAAFNYDMRRLNEILDVPKAWYKRDLYRRMFLGKSGVYARGTANKSHMTESNSSPSSSTISSAADRKYNVPNKSTAGTDMVTPRRQKSFRKTQGHRRTISGGSFLGNIMGSPTGLFLPRASASVGSRGDYLQRSFDASTKRTYEEPFGSTLKVPNEVEPQLDDIDGQSSSSKGKAVSEWKSRVLFALNLSRLDVSTNMGNVMGQSIWSTNDLQAQSQMLFTNTGTKTTRLLITVRQGSFDAHGGIVGGYIDVSNIVAKGNFKENLGENPSHLASVSLEGAETRLDYMGSCILMATLSGFKCDLEDSWILTKLGDENPLEEEENEFFVYTSSTAERSTENRPEIKVNGQLGWNELQIVMSRSTTPDFIKMLGKLQDFFNQQQRSGMHAFAAPRPLHASSSLPLSRANYKFGQKRELGMDEKQDETDAESKNDGLKYQHWVEILNGIPGLELTNVSQAFEDKNVLIGGKLTLKSNSVSLTCFHGSNFRAHTWALFSINEPIVRYSSEMSCVEKSCQVERAFSLQEIVVQLGHGDHFQPAHEKTRQCGFMATVRKVSRGRRNPPSLGASVVDWLEYVTSTNDNSSSSESSSFVGRLSSKPPSVKRVSFAPKVKYENDSEIIFGMPCFLLSLTNEHDQPMTTRIAKILCKNAMGTVSPWLSTVPSPHVVDSSVVSDFRDSLSVTMDVSLFLFLHDLIITYLKEKDAVAVVSSQGGRPYRGSKAAEQKQENVAIESTDAKVAGQVETQKKKEKYRQFRSKAWKLEPGIRLLGWAGTRVDPVNIDWVLEKLGFSHASVTIPKWIQRGAMDPMDISLSLLVKRLLAEMQSSTEKAT